MQLRTLVRATILVLAGPLAATASAATASAAAKVVGESPAVRAALANEVQRPGVLMATGGRSAGPFQPSGQLDMSRATAYSNTWRQSSGVATTRTYLQPVNYHGADGAWHAIDTTLVSGVGDYENAANAFSVRIAESLTAGISVSSQGGTLGFTPLGAATAPAIVSGSTASYHEALPQTDLEYTSEPYGVEEFATLKGHGAPERISYVLSLSAGLRPVRSSSGGVDIEDSQGHAVFSIPAPTAAPESDPTAVRTLPMTLEANAAGWVLTVGLTDPWLRSALAAGPVRIDPTVAVNGLFQTECTLAEENPTTSTCETKLPKLGYDSTHKEHRALLQFGGPPYPQTRVLDATLALKVLAHSTTNAKAVAIYPLSHAWTYRLSAGATWNEYETGHNWATPGGDYLKPPANSDGLVNSAVGAATTTYYWHPTTMVQKWATGAQAPNEAGYADYGFIVKDEPENSVQNLLELEKSPGTYLEVVWAADGEGTDSQYTYVREPLTDRSSISVNVGSGNLMVSANDMEIPGIAGMNFHSTRTWNSFNNDNNSYSGWTDSNYALNHAQVFSDGTVAVENPDGGWFTFIAAGEHKFIRPAGIHAYMCEEGSPEPCNPTEKFPTGEKYRLNYQGTGEYIYYNSEAVGNGLHNRFGDTIKAEYPTTEKAIYTDTHGHKIEELFNTYHNITEIKDLTGGRSTKYTYGSGAATEIRNYTDAAAAETQYSYERGSGEPKVLSKINLPGGEVTNLAYNLKDQVTEITRTNNALHTTGPTTRLLYYEIGKAPGKYCASSQQATIVRDPDWTKPAKEEIGANFVLAPHETLYCTNSLDEVERTFDANGNETVATYDKYENLHTQTAPARETGSARGISTHIYDQTGQLLECETSDRSTEATSCPTIAEKIGLTASAAYTDGIYKFQPSSLTSTTRNTTELCYYGTSGCEPTGKTGALRQITRPGTNKAHAIYEYEANGNVSASTDFKANKTTYEYEALGNLSAIKPPAGSGIGKTTLTHDSENRPRTISRCLVTSGETCTSSETATITYDADDRVTQEVYTGPGAEKTIKYKYTADGWLEERTDPSGTTKYKRDPLGQTTEETLPGALSNGYTYDEAGNLESFTDAGGTTHYVYNGLNQLEKMYEPGGTCTEPAPKCTHFAYDKGGALTKTTYPSGAALLYKRGPLTGRITAAEALGTKGETLLAHTYEYASEAKNDTPLIYKDILTAPGGVTAETQYSYESKEGDELTQANTLSTMPEYKHCYRYKYDVNGNRTREELSAAANTCTEKTIYSITNAGNQLQCRTTGENCAAPLTSYAYDGAGNETSITSSETTKFAYNNLNQLQGLTPPGEPEQTASFLGSGQTWMTALGTTTLQNSQLGITKQTNGTGTSYYARTPGGTMVDERLPGATYNPVYDAQGDIVGLINASGELAQTVRYGPYGENATAGGLAYSPTTDPFLFQGGYHMPGGQKGEGNIPNGLYHYGERYYDATSGDWTQLDSHGGGYEFAGDNPVHWSDPTGECVFDKYLYEPVIYYGKYAYIDICGTKGKGAGKTVGWLRVKPGAVKQGGAGCHTSSLIASREELVFCEGVEGEGPQTDELPTVDLKINPPRFGGGVSITETPSPGTDPVFVAEPAFG